MLCVKMYVIGSILVLYQPKGGINMNDIVRAFDGLPWIVKLILALPGIDGIAWGIYRIAKGVSTNNGVMIIVGIIWLFVGFFLFWIIDMFTLLTTKEVTFFA